MVVYNGSIVVAAVCVGGQPYRPVIEVGTGPVSI